MKTKLTLLLIFSIFIFGCTESDRKSTSDFSGLELGMSYKDVLKLLGSPSSIDKNEDGTQSWMYFNIKTNNTHFKNPYWFLVIDDGILILSSNIVPERYFKIPKMSWEIE